MDVAEATRDVQAFMVKLSDRIAEHFPHHAVALRGELFGERLTNERWNRITAILASLAALPGTTFGQDEHKSRGLALQSVVVAQKMAAAKLGLYKDDPDSLADFAVWLARDIEQQFGQKPGQES
ncbi:MAG: hypothetical protein JO112_20185 [Planctomycetes bacterium]|nr:hypothetical protein [Planctomycetota bacterium]